MPTIPNSDRPFGDRAQTSLTMVDDKALATALHVSEVTLWRWVRKGILPRPTYLTPTTARWPVRVIEAWVMKQQGKRHRPYHRGCVKQQVDPQSMRGFVAKRAARRADKSAKKVERVGG
jgi:predicted DNA-binding transcriptional regulator AlpA